MGSVQAKEPEFESEEAFTLTIDENAGELSEERVDLPKDEITENEEESIIVEDDIENETDEITDGGESPEEIVDWVENAEEIEPDESIIADEEVLAIPTYQGEMAIDSVGGSSYAILNGSGIVNDGKRTYMALSDGIYASADDNSVIISNDKAENLNYGDGKLYYTVESDNGTIVKVIDVENNMELTEILLSGCSLRHMYLVNDSDLLFSAGGRIYILNPVSGSCERYGSYEGVFSFIPTKNGILYATGSLFNYSIYAEDKFISYASDYYTDDEYLCYSLNGEDFSIKLDMVFENISGDIAKYSENPYEVIGAEEFTEELENVVPTEENEEEIVVAKEIVNCASAEKKTVKLAVSNLAGVTETPTGTICNFTKKDGNYVPELSNIQKAIQDKARDVYNYTWTPLKKIKEWDVSMEAYTLPEDKYNRPTIMHGAPYCQTRFGGVIVLYKMTMDEFMQETVKEESKLYSTNITDWVWNKETGDDLRYGPWYGFDCSTFASYCVGIEEVKNLETTSSIDYSKNFVKKGNRDSADPVKLYEGIKVGDVLNKGGDHVIVVTDIQYDMIGKIVQIETIEQTEPCTAKKIYYSLSNLYKNVYEDEDGVEHDGSDRKKYYLYRSLRSDNDNVPLFSISRPEETLYVTETCKLEGCGLPSAKITWKSSDTTIATVDSTGLVTPKKAGKVTITATANIEAAVDGKVTAKVYLEFKNPEFIEFSSKTKTIYTGEYFNISAKAMPEGGTYSYSSSDKTIAQVSTDGCISGLKGGSATITVKYTKNKKSCSEKINITVKKRTIELNEIKKTMYYKQTFQLKATVTPENAPVNWSSSNPKIVTVDNTGKIEIIKNTSTASDSPVKLTAKLATGEKKTCSITVKKPSLKIDKTSATLYTAGLINLSLTATPTPANGCLVEWSSSNTSVATVDSTGKVTAKAKGSANIKAKLYAVGVNGTKSDCGISKSCKVTVKNPSISLSKTKIEDLYIGNTKKLTATVKPSGTAVAWTTSKTSVVEVDSKGKLTGKSEGTATVTATIYKGTANEKSATCKVTVIKPTLKLDKSTATVYRGFSATIKATPKPSATVTYSSSNTSIATVESSGKIIGKKAGSATITVTANGISKTCKVTVENPTLDVTKSSEEIVKGKSKTLEKKTTPSGAAVNWKSSDTSIATVDSTGKVTAKKAGTVTITASLENATDVKDTCKITVKPVLVVEEKSVLIKKGDKKTVKVTNNGDEALSCYVSSSYSPSGAATVVKAVKTKSGVKITACSTGSAVVTVKSGNETETINVSCYQ